MAGSYLDTTIVVDIADERLPGKDKAVAHLAANSPAVVPYYALRELLAGHVQYICLTHNVMKASECASEAFTALMNRCPAEGRQREGKMRILLSAMQKAYNTNPQGGKQDEKREILQHLALRVNGMWRRSHRLHSVSLVQSLNCFNDGKLTYGPSGELKGPHGSFNCATSERCAAAEYLYEQKDAVKKMIAALHPKVLDSKAASKNENQQRRKALKELLTEGPAAFNKGKCRALGDAYFAAMSPPGYSVVTTNIQDYLPLCQALAKIAIVP
jgi:hypothetical protein